MLIVSFIIGVGVGALAIIMLEVAIDDGKLHDDRK